MSAHPDVPPPVFRAAVFDMDGLLIDSEPFWWEAEQAVFAEVGVRLTDADCVQTMGLRVDEVVAHWAARRSWQGVPLERVAERIVQRVIEFVRTRGKEMAGAGRALSLCEGLGLRLGLASSSSPEIIYAGLDRLGFAGRFEVVRSAAHEARGKPHPDVYLSACAGLGIPRPTAWRSKTLPTAFAPPGPPGCTASRCRDTISPAPTSSRRSPTSSCRRWRRSPART